MRAQNDPLSMDELRAVTIQEIEAAERALLEGCDYRLRTHHPYGAIKVLASDVVSFLTKSQGHNTISDYDYTHTLDETTGGNSGSDCHASPRSVVYEHQPYHHHDDHLGLDTLCERALSIAQSALVYSDINFLFRPGQIAFAAVALALDSHAYSKDESATCNRLGTKMREYMCAKFSQKSEEEISEYEEQVSKIISNLENCSAIDLEMFSPFWQFHQRRYARTAEREAIKIRRVIFTASRLRVMSRASFRIATAPSPTPPQFGYHQHHRSYHHNHHYNEYHYEGSRRKRGRDEEEDAWTPEHHHHSYRQYHHNKIARVTPINTPFI